MQALPEIDPRERSHSIPRVFHPEYPPENLAYRAATSADCLLAFGRTAHAVMAFRRALEHDRATVETNPEFATLRTQLAAATNVPLQRLIKLPLKPTVSMSMLGINGRFGNQVFQYAFIKLYSIVHGLALELPDWIGRQLFVGCADPMLTSVLPFRMEFEDGHAFSSRVPVWDAVPASFNVDIQGYFQFHTATYAPYRSLIRSFFQPRPEIREKLDRQVATLRRAGKTLVALHIRRGDIVGTDASISTALYLDWLRGIWPSLTEPVLIVATDDPAAVLPDFAEFAPKTVAADESIVLGADFYSDFYALTQADILAASSSTFSFAASLLNTNALGFYRPNSSRTTIERYDPWWSIPLV
jgi:hypothetical protein